MHQSVSYQYKQLWSSRMTARASKLPQFGSSLTDTELKPITYLKGDEELDSGLKIQRLQFRSNNTDSRDSSWWCENPDIKVSSEINLQTSVPHSLKQSLCVCSTPQSLETCLHRLRSKITETAVDGRRTPTWNCPPKWRSWFHPHHQISKPQSRKIWSKRKFWLFNPRISRHIRKAFMSSHRHWTLNPKPLDLTYGQLVSSA